MYAQAYLFLNTSFPNASSEFVLLFYCVKFQTCRNNFLPASPELCRDFVHIYLTGVPTAISHFKAPLIILSCYTLTTHLQQIVLRLSFQISFVKLLPDICRQALFLHGRNATHLLTPIINIWMNFRRDVMQNGEVFKERPDHVVDHSRLVT